MFEEISWSPYLIYLLIASLVFYLFIWIVFNKANLSLLPGLSPLQPFGYGKTFRTKFSRPRNT